MLQLKTRNNQVVKKVLIYGLPGHGKSTFASSYCKKHNLKPVVLDIDDTNFTGDALVDLDLRSDLKTFNSIMMAIKNIQSSEFDTIIIDGLGSLLELLVSKAKGQKKFLDRSDRFKAIFNELIKSDLNLIFIGQNDCNLESYTESLPNKSIIQVNSIVNEIYYCVRDGENFVQTIDKFRKELDKQNEATDKKRNEPETKNEQDSDFQTANNVADFVDDPVSRNYLEQLKNSLIEQNIPVTKQNIKKEAIQQRKDPDTDVDSHMVENLFKLLENEDL